LNPIGRWLVAGVVLLLGRGRRRRQEPRERLLPTHTASPRAENLTITLLLGAALGGIGFVLAYLLEPNTQLLGLCLGLALACLAAALIVAGKALVPQEEAVEERGRLSDEQAEREVRQLVREGVEGLSRRRLLVAAAGTAGAALTAGLIVPVGALGPVLDTERLLRTPWRRGRRLVDEAGRAIFADDVVEGVFLTAFPEGAPKSTLDSPLVVIRLPEQMLRLPDERSGWAPEGVLAFSKICPHAGCAVSLYRWPSFEPTAPGPALVCPCHYSTFDPTRGGRLLFGPAGRDLPQLPLRIAAGGALEAGGEFLEGIGPSWWGVRRS
jgi:ubiquinol-cytochrome c reductase iron-sulfur subunit